MNWDYQSRDDLVGWKWTSAAIRRTLEQRFPGGVSVRSIENGDRAALNRFLNQLPRPEDCAISVVYLASHQTPAGEWEFPDRTTVAWADLLKSTRIPPHGGRIVILDSCHADSVRGDPLWSEFAGACFYSSSGPQEAHELNFRSRRPIDLARHYPAVAGWLRSNLGDQWRGRLSLLGLAWVDSWLREQPGQAAMSGDFFKACEETARTFAEGRGGRLASSVQFVREQ